MWGESPPRDQQQTRWRDPRTLWLLDRWNNQGTVRREVFASPAVSVQGQSPSERSFGIRSRRSYSSGRFPFNVFSVRSLKKCVLRKVFPTLSINLPLFWLYRKLLRPSWFACLIRLTTSRSVATLLRFKTNMFCCGDIYLDVINLMMIIKSYIFLNAFIELHEIMES